MTGWARQAIPTGLLGDEGKSKAHHESRYSGPMAGELKRSNFARLITILRKRRPITDDQTNATPSLRRQHDYMRSFSSMSHGDETPEHCYAMPYAHFLILARRHAPLSSDVIDVRAVSQYASLFSSFMLTICYDTFRFCTHHRVLMCCPIILHTLSYFSWLRFLSYICM